MKYPEWLRSARSEFNFKTVSEFEKDDEPSIYLIHFGAPVRQIEEELDAGVKATCFVNLDDKVNNITLYSRLQNDGWEIGYDPRISSNPITFNGELTYLRQFFDINHYWCERSYTPELNNAFFSMRDHIEDILNPSNSTSQVLIVGNV